jgi:D-sedoheptulose 7-phosphate isomerase
MTVIFMSRESWSVVAVHGICKRRRDRAAAPRCTARLGGRTPFWAVSRAARAMHPLTFSVCFSEGSMSSLFQDNLGAHLALFSTLRSIEPAVVAAGRQMATTLRDGSKIMLCGNGGSAADSQHIAAELTGRFIHDRRPLAAIALSTDTSALTCIANDYSFDAVFARQVEALGRAGDCLVAISTSGNSPNVLRAAETAKRIGMVVIGLLGRDGGRLATLCDLPIVVPEQSTARIQEAHIFIGHTLCGR